MIALAIAAVALQTQVVVPDIQPGCNQPFIAAVAAVKTALSEEKFDEAARLAAALPSMEVTYTVREDTIPEEYRAYALKAIGRAVEIWTGQPVGLKVTRTETNPDIVVSFAPQLGVDPEVGKLLGGVHFIGFSPDEPRVESVIGMKRGDPIRSTETYDIASEMSFAIGSRIGLERSPIPGTPMGRTESTLSILPRMTPADGKMALVNIELADALRKAAATHTKIALPEPGAYIDVNEIQGPTVMQGEAMPMSFQISNNGKTPLKYRVVPDCGCFKIPVPTGEIAPGSAVIVKFDIDTMNFPGKLDKNLFVYTTDPEMPVKRIPVKGMAEYMYRFITPTGKSVFQYQKNYQELEVFLEVNPNLAKKDKDFKFNGYKMEGIKGTAEFEPFEGEMADPARGEESRSRAGFKIKLHVEPHNLPGRQEGIISLETTSKFAPVMRWNYSLQNGIAVNPGRIYFGEIDGKPNRAWAVLNGAGKKFNITKVESDTEFITGFWEPFNDENTKIVALFKGGAPIGQFDAVISVYTDDPDQPKIDIPVQGIVK
jgi:hypothetical protein